MTYFRACIKVWVLKNRAGSKKYGYTFIHIGAKGILEITIVTKVVDYVAPSAADRAYVLEQGRIVKSGRAMGDGASTMCTSSQAQHRPI